jgi:hypothetical protein
MTDSIIPNGGGVPSDGSPEGHNEAMLKMSEPEGAAPAAEPEGGVPARPENVPEKFWDAAKGAVNTEALLKAQADAEAALRRAQNGEPEVAPEAEPEVAPEAQVNVVENASTEFAEKGELSDGTFAALEKVGLSRDMVNEYIAGQTAIVTQLDNAAFEPFQGEDGYKEAINWAADNLTDEEKQALNVQLTSNQAGIVSQGAKALAKIYAENIDVEPSTIRGNSNGSTAGGVYQSSREMMKDMASSKYKTDSAFRREVQEKLARSDI